jgi:hypothetical protein
VKVKPVPRKAPRKQCVLCKAGTHPALLDARGVCLWCRGKA